MSSSQSSSRDHERDRMPADRDKDDSAVQATSGANALLGLWLMITPSIFDYQDRPALAISQGVVGLLLLASAGFRLGKPRTPPWLSWLNVALGLWLTMAPFLLLSSSTDEAAAHWNSGIAGAVVVALGAWSAVSTQRGHARRKH